LRLRMLVLTGLAIFFLGIAAVGNAAAGEKLKVRNVWYGVKWEPIDVGDEKGHLIALLEGKGIQTVLEGESFQDGSVVREMGLADINTETGTGHARGYIEVTDRDGDKYYVSWEGMQLSAGYWEGGLICGNGAGKYQGINGEGTWSAHVVAPMQWYSEWDVDVNFPGQ